MRNRVEKYGNLVLRIIPWTLYHRWCNNKNTFLIRKTKVLRKQPRRNLEWFTQRLTPENNKYFLIQGWTLNHSHSSASITESSPILSNPRDNPLPRLSHIIKTSSRQLLRSYKPCHPPLPPIKRYPISFSSRGQRDYIGSLIFESRQDRIIHPSINPLVRGKRGWEIIPSLFHPSVIHPERCCACQPPSARHKCRAYQPPR